MGENYGTTRSTRTTTRVNGASEYASRGGTPAVDRSGHRDQNGDEVGAQQEPQEEPPNEADDPLPEGWTISLTGRRRRFRME